ncbi:MAG: enoyl-CoA hydratase/isomerase family protein [Bacillaceae bacterium]|nr:enoyl-CoA hydratase/isomerase family protein [Bacillaceae bacterium]
MKVMIKRVENQAKITLQESAGLAIVTLYRPRVRNALSTKMWEELEETGQRILHNPKNRVVILRGSRGYFTAGSDIKEFYKMSVEDAEEAFEKMEKAISTFETLPLPTLCMMNGPAMGAGLELALACDLRIGSPNVKLGIPVGRLGIMLNNKFTKRLVDLIGPGRTKDLVYTGRFFDAEESYQLGLLNYLVEEDELDSFTIKTARIISRQSAASLYAIKRSVSNCIQAHKECWEDSNFVHPHDFPEGVASFVEKRKPHFKSRPYDNRNSHIN